MSRKKMKVLPVFPKREDRTKLFLASGFFLGLAPVVPGSFGALTGLLWHLVALPWGFSDGFVRLWCLVGVIVFSVLHYRLTPWAQARWKCADPRHFVLDEIVGYLCVPLFWALPAESPLPIWAMALLGFVVFRILDAIKLPFARYIDRNIHTANGVLFDDVVSAFYTALVVSGIAWLAA